MKLLLRSFLLPLLVTLSACGTLEVRFDRTSVPVVAGTGTLPLSENQFMQPVALEIFEPASPVEGNRRGMIYFWLTHPAFDPKDPYNQIDVGRLVRLPSSCVLTIAQCPPPQDVPAPFQMYPGSWHPLAWSPDGTMAALPVALTDDIAPISVYLYRPGNGLWTKIADFPIVDSLSWSPDGSWLSMRVQDGFGDSNIYAMRSDGSGQRNLTGDNLPDKGESSFLVMSGWFEGKALIAIRGIYSEPTNFYQVDPATGETNLLFAFPTYPGGIYPAPDNTLLAVEVSSREKQTLEIIQPDGKVAQTLTSFSKGGIYIVTWSHDGQKIAFTVQRDPYTYDDHRVYLINRDGTGLSELYRGLVIPALTFSPDDRYLLFTDQERALVSISLDSRTAQKVPVPLAETGEQVLYPSWQP